MSLMPESPIGGERLARCPRSIGRADARAARRTALERQQVASFKAAAVNRVVLCYGSVLIGWYPAGALAEVLADVERWGADPNHFAALPWPRCCYPSWEWNTGEELAVWEAGRLLAVVEKTAAGAVVVRRLC